MINDFFYWCVNVLEIIGNVTVMGYELANIVIYHFTSIGNYKMIPTLYSRFYLR